MLEFELSSTCNLECVMCNGKVSSSIRKNRDKLPPIKSPYDDAFVEQLKEFIPHLREAKFYGGEPLLIPIYYKIWDLILDMNPKVKIFVITNGTTLNDRIKKMLERGNFDVAVSMDSPEKDALESIRLNTEHKTVIENIHYFNDYCKRKKKNLVISFTLMRINWKEFPKIIRFCNSIDAILYVSYLKTPPKFALWNLPYDELQAIKSQISNETFPEGSFAQKSNKRCYEDFLTYLDNCIETNKTRPASDIIPIETIAAAAEQTDHSISLNENESGGDELPVYDRSVNYKDLVADKLRLHNSERNAADSDIEEFFNRLENTTSNHFRNGDVNKLYYYISITDIETAYKDVMRFSEGQLKEAIEAVIG